MAGARETVPRATPAGGSERAPAPGPQGSQTSAQFAVSAPKIELPKGGGAIRGIGEKFAANPVTGTGSMSVPIATTPGRSGFGPQLALSYDSGAGNGSFGFGWNLSLPAITRKTDKGLPQYLDADESDVFIVSGSEDLVPVYRQDIDGTWVAAHAGHTRDADGSWVRDPQSRLVVHEYNVDGFRVRRYRPRIEGLFARIERWSKIGTPSEVHWRSISKDNVLTRYGLDSDSRIADPLDPTRIFSWLICETRDDRGNGVLYRYKPEDGLGIELGNACERNRGARDDVRRTANRYLKRIYYGNRKSLLDQNSGLRPPFLGKATIEAQFANHDWMFEVVFDYLDHDRAAPTPYDDTLKDGLGALKYPWPERSDPFSSYRSGFEVRTSRVCQRVLMFHHFPGEADVGRDCLVRSTDFRYSDEVDPADVRNPVYTFLTSVTQTGYRRSNGGYSSRSLPPVEFEYTEPKVQDTVEEIDGDSLENLPVGLDGSVYRWTDLHGEGISGILTEQGDAWLYKRNLSAIPEQLPNGRERVKAQFAPMETVRLRPTFAFSDGAEIMDLAGDGQPDLVVMNGPTPGLFEHDDAEGWQPFRPFTSRLNRDLRDPNLKFIDLDGDGHADALISEDDAFVWHASLAEKGFGPARRVVQALDEEKGPRIVFADGTQSIYLADLSGDGLSDIVRIRNGEVCYWPNLGYSRFGAKVTMDNAPRFDSPDQFDQKRVRLADIDGSGTTDILYVHREGVRLYFNQSGNGWSQPHQLPVFPRVDDVVSIVPTDLLGNGTACLVWSSPLPGDARRPMRYVNLMGGTKPHLLVKTINNFGAETHVDYAPSTKFYLQDKRDGKPWITRLPFPVHVVERVQTYDHVSRNRFVTRYAYHHGYFDGVEREFRGFGMVEHWDTEEFAALTDTGTLPPGANIAVASHVPPILTRTWFHTGAYLGREHISDFFAGLLDDTDRGEYFREPGLTDPEARELLLPDTVLPSGLSAHEQREACRALKGSMLRQEVYAQDAGAGATAEQRERARTPYTVTEQNFSIRLLQPRGDNCHAVFFTHAREAINFHYERNPADPRVQHALTLEVDEFGNVLKEALAAYGRRQEIRIVDAMGQVQKVPNPGLNTLLTSDATKQTTTLLTYTENQVTNAIGSPDAHRSPLPCEARTFELTGYVPTGPTERYQASDLVEPDPNLPGRLRHRFTAEVAYEDAAVGARRRRPIEWLRTLYRSNGLGQLLPLGTLESLALSGESYKLAFTPGLLAQIFKRPRPPQPPEDLLPNPADVLGSSAGDGGGYVQSQTLKADGRFPIADADGCWWLPSGRSFFTTNPEAPATELTAAQKVFFVPRRYQNPFGQSAIVDFDADHLLLVETRDALHNRMTVDRRDYRVLQPCLVSDSNRNQTEVVFDTLGLVVATAVMGKPFPAPVEGDSAAGLVADLTRTEIDGFMSAADPHVPALPLLKDATTRILYDLDRFRRTQQANPSDPVQWQPACAATIVRETHARESLPPHGLKIQVSYSYSDGFGREIQKKIQAEPVKANGIAGPPRWVGTGWTIFNNKGKPVLQYEPFFSATHTFEFGMQVGVSPVLFYDPAERLIATLHPNHTYEKVRFDPWQQTTYDVNDTCAPRNQQTGDPRTDPDISGYVARYFASLPTSPPALGWMTWYAQKIVAAEQDDRNAAVRAASHADTPTTAHFDTLGRPFLTVARNRVVCANHAHDGTEDEIATRVDLDIEGNQTAVRDAVTEAWDANGNAVEDELGRIVMRYAYDMLGNRIYRLSMEAGARWMLNDATGKPIRSWDSRGHASRTDYDPMRRLLRSFVTGTDLANPNATLLTERLVYGEQHPDDQIRNLRGKLYLHLDQAGATTTEAFDFKGNALRSSRRIALEYKKAIGWGAADAALPANAAAKFNAAALEAAIAPALAADTFSSSTTYDALSRPVSITTPHTPAMARNVIRPGYNEANLLERVDVNLREAQTNGQPVWTAFVADIDYDAKGQRLRIDYGNGVSTFYDYDPLTFRLTHLRTQRNVVTFPDDCARPPPNGWPGCNVQNLHYVHDPAGNIASIRDEAQQRIYFSNTRVEPSSEYVYDALYRLIQATGREHLGQNGAPSPHSYDDAARIRRPHPNDGAAMARYCEKYVYDAVGNFNEMSHHRECPNNPSWRRRYSYDETSIIEDGAGGTPRKTSNRLSQTAVGNLNPITERYVHDAHGNTVRTPQLAGAHPAPNMHWDYRDQLRKIDRGGGGTAYYVYDAAGQRRRKVLEKGPGLTEERLYFDGFELFRRHAGPIGSNSATLERETMHVLDDKQRIALVERRTLDVVGDDKAPQQMIRYQLCNHLGSASLELDEQANIISYEEYLPYGSSAYQAVRAATDTTKRFRFAAKERDEESGIVYFGARYYTPWLGRWISCDPSGNELQRGYSNSYQYCRCRPTGVFDPDGRDIVVLAESKISAKDLVDKIKKDTSIPQRIRDAINLDPKSPTNITFRKGIEGGKMSKADAAVWNDWKSLYSEAEVAARGKQFAFTTGQLNILPGGDPKAPRTAAAADVPANSLGFVVNREFSAQRGGTIDVSKPDQGTAGITIPSMHQQEQLKAEKRETGGPKVVDDALMDKRGLIVVVDRMVLADKTVLPMTDREIVHTFFHELALHGGGMAQADVGIAHGTTRVDNLEKVLTALLPREQSATADQTPTSTEKQSPPKRDAQRRRSAPKQ